VKCLDNDVKEIPSILLNVVASSLCVVAMLLLSSHHPRHHKWCHIVILPHYFIDCKSWISRKISIYGYSTLVVFDQHPPISTKYQANISPSCIVHKTLLVQHLSVMNLCNGIILIAYQALQAVMMNITTSPNCNRYLDIEKNTS
jgi:hypothetical protein